ncbi:MAG: hypothetical protein ABS83_04315 [Rhodospirillales bacterium SCN 65-16]|nr:MAG: hypothetical protein ABS83_04315 [Rhodospirillales bacterium SCN 65-16]
MSQSRAIVSFIANLLPLYTGEEASGIWCARSLSDGTLILPLEGDGDDGDHGDAFVTVLWQGDPQRSSVVLASFVASLAVARYVELRFMAESSKDTKNEMERLAQHYRFKTGDSLCFEAPSSGVAELVGKAVSKVGEAAVTEALKKILGM